MIGFSMVVETTHPVIEEIWLTNCVPKTRGIREGVKIQMYENYVGVG